MFSRHILCVADRSQLTGSSTFHRHKTSAAHWPIFDTQFLHSQQPAGQEDSEVRPPRAFRRARVGNVTWPRVYFADQHVSPAGTYILLRVFRKDLSSLPPVGSRLTEVTGNVCSRSTAPVRGTFCHLCRSSFLLTEVLAVATRD